MLRCLAIALGLATALTGTPAGAQLNDDGVPPPGLDGLPEELSPIDPTPTVRTFDPLPGDRFPAERELPDDLVMAPPPSLEPAPLLSTGAAYRDNLTYFVADILLVNRDTFFDFPLASDSTAGSNRRLVIERGESGLAALGRFTVGQYVARDRLNRDHALEFTFSGLGEWVVDGAVQSVGDNLLTSDIDPFIGGFNGSDTQRFQYASDFDNYEVNYRLAWRPGRDRAVLLPSGQWEQQMTPATLFSLLAGIRVVQVDELLSYTARSTDPDVRRADLNIRSNNDLVGFQIGGDFFRQHTVWSYGVRGKVGAYVNFTSQSTELAVVDPVFVELNRSDRAEDDTLAFVGELGVFARYHITPRVSFRIAYEALWQNSVALAPEQINFLPGNPAEVNTAGSQWYQGMSLGLELYW